MNNDLELIENNKNEIDDKLKIILLNIIKNEIPNNKRNAIIYLNKLLSNLNNEDENVLGYLSSNICKNIINELITDINSAIFRKNYKVVDLIDKQLKILESKNIEISEDELSDDDIDEEIERLKSRKRQKTDKEYLKLININNTINNKLDYFKSLDDIQKNNYIDILTNLNDNINEKPILLQLADLNTTEKNKKIILAKINTFNTLEKNSGEYCKLNSWIKDVMRIPFGNYIDITKNYKTKKEINNKISNIKKILDNEIYGHHVAKNSLLQYLAELIYNKKEINNIITLQGPPGIGKTALIQNGLSKAFDLPFNFISLGGATDSSHLEGFDYTYEGSTYGKIVDILSRSKCMNPVIYFDELDKVSETAKGQEIINILTHMTDTIQNNHFNDKYFTGIDIDLSKVIFIFSCNDLSKISNILLDRMYIIKLESFTNIDKIKISQNHLLPQLNKKFKEDIEFSEELINYLINSYTYEGGIRKLKELFYEILREINLRNLTNKKILNKRIKFPLILNKDIISNDILNHKMKIEYDKIHNEPKVGIINGLWASTYGIGGIAPIEVVYSYSVNNLELDLTGSQGEVMQESMRVAKSVALNILTECKISDLFKKLNKNKLNGLHIHCPDGATPIDGPSAGCAIAIAIYSLLINKPIDNTIAITGELTLQGNITEIGGLKEKIYGAINAGVKTVLYPVENNNDIKKILNNNNIKNKIKLVEINSINDAIKYIFKK